MSKYTNIRTPVPEFGSKLTTLILDLDRLRHLELGGTTPPHIFFQLKEIFHFLESLGSARIEGNRTTLSEYIESRISEEKNPSESIKEIRNNENVLEFIEEHVMNRSIDHSFIRECQKLIVAGLNPRIEGDRNPGKYRSKDVSILNSKHTPPSHVKVQEYMDELVNYIGDRNSPQFDLLKTAIAHHRFAWIHPFENGNGRTVRALTYAMLIKQEFNVQTGRIVNPTAIFCSDRDKYYDMLEKADTGEDNHLLEWVEYVLTGLKLEIEKIDKLTNYDYLRPNILEPAIEDAFKTKLINKLEHDILEIALDRKPFMAGDIKHLFGDVAHTEISRTIREMKSKKLIKSIEEGGRKYTIEFANGYLLRGVMKALDVNEFLPIKDEV